ncbi:MAG: DNA cytosine methyltransferase [Nanoarchaeota archaeon]|nr:DNA cytosine methyltransferase [Nanoarchaeota archaeon]
MKVIDLFCGCGGLSEGFEDAGFNIVCGNDVDKNMVESFKLNHPNAKAILGDITKIPSEELLNNNKKEDITLIIGGPPCQGFSSVGDRKEEDPRNKLFYEFVRVVKDIKPKIFVLENVTGILTMQGGKVKEIIKQEFEKLGYNVTIKILNAEEYGVPQKRRRVFFVGNLFGKEFEFPKVEFDGINKPFRTVWETIGDLPQIDSGKESKEYLEEPKTDFQKLLRNGQKELLYHSSPNHSEIMIKRMENIKQGQNHSNLPKELKLNKGYPNIYGRLIADEPSDTITGNCGCISAPGRFIHPLKHRAITVREASRLQSFRDNKIFVGNQNSKYKQVGNAVPPLLAKALALRIKDFLSENTR